MVFEHLVRRVTWDRLSIKVALIAIRGRHGHPLHPLRHQRDRLGELVNPGVPAPRILRARLWKLDDLAMFLLGCFMEHVMQIRTLLLVSPTLSDEPSCM